MYRSFRARKFRCFTDIQVNDLARINLIAGLNNVGKTALLEALLIYGGIQNPNVALTLDVFRGLRYGGGPSEANAPWLSLFQGFEAGNPVEFEGERDPGGKRLVRLRIVDDLAEFFKEARESDRETSEHALLAALGSGKSVLAVDLEDDDRSVGRSYIFPDYKSTMSMHQVLTRFPAPPPVILLAASWAPSAAESAERYGRMEVLGQQDAVRDALRVAEPGIERLAVVVVGQTPVLHGDIGLGHLIPLPLMGEGMTRIFNIVVGIGNAPKGVVLVDEIENGLHHSVLRKVWRVIAEAARQFDVQVFATTHSFECIEAAHRAFDEDLGFEYDFRLHRLERVNGNIVARTSDREALWAALDMGLEVR